MKSNIKYHQKLNIFIKKAVVIFVITFSFLSVVACKSSDKSSEPESLDDEDERLSSSCFNTSSSSGNYSWDNNSLVAFRLLTQATFGQQLLK